ncbi:MAG TPA: pantoate--beta-alanine ligase [Chryseolinea sp.]|nr:pantoate--beta-alanine ligase [Chryseolinea sp.]
MVIVKKASDLSEFIDFQKKKGNVIGFTPTMGALHSGHLELISRSTQLSGTTVCSIFVNPTQFNDSSDYSRYPKKIESDVKILVSAGADLLFLPEPDEIYPKGTDNLELYDLGYLNTVLEGKYRPGHFQGVAQVMSRLLKLVNANLLFMGQKDYQQCMVVQRLIDQMGISTRLVTCPTVREVDGLAKSSRNLRLSPEERTLAPLIYQSMQEISRRRDTDSPTFLKEETVRTLTEAGFRVDYVEIATADTLQPLEHWSSQTPSVVLVAAFLGETRLIDNMLLQL